jgi:molybdenum-dependent DNA-binding transcriptional regulator ModE
LSIILKNLADPVKSQDAKYRTLKLDNAKLQAGLFSIPAMMELLTKLFGFANTDKTAPNTLTVSYEALNQGLCQQTLIAIGECQSQIVVNTSVGGTGTSSSSSTSNNKRMMATESLSEKQKARRLLEEKQQAEKVRAKEERKRNVAMLKQDKLVRETDPNWKPGVSAACAKSGTGISTFRDRHGEQ